MTRNVATADMARRAASVLALTAALIASPALAGDRALADFIGYSEDGRYFAFEEFGQQDGSGFPYSNIYVIDLPADKWVSGSPYRALLQNEDASVDDAREAAFELAEAKLDELEIDEAAMALSINGEADPRADIGDELTFGRPGYGLDAALDTRTLVLESFSADSPEPCEDYSGEKALGFALFLDGNEIYRDGDPLPKSRGCPLGYKIYAVVAPAEWTMSQAGLLAVISNYPFGFEGPDRRFIVVPLPQ